MSKVNQVYIAVIGKSISYNLQLSLFLLGLQKNSTPLCNFISKIVRVPVSLNAFTSFFSLSQRV